MMITLKVTYLLIPFFLFSSFSFSLTDTIYKKKHFNHVEYYADHSVKVFGNMKDSVKTGYWIYLKQGGKLLAEGLYQDGKKIGKWKYVDYKNKQHTHKWVEGQQPDEKIRFENNRLIMYDHLNTHDPSGNIFLNFRFGVLESYILD
jgi:antitoxin component YwqK of YwqJK toxin-antitoxin module